jgi:hypothetical protein
MPGPSRNFHHYEVVDFSDNYISDSNLFLPDSDSDYSGNDIEVWNSAVPAHTVSATDDDDDDDDYGDDNNNVNDENYREILWPEQHIPRVFS